MTICPNCKANDSIVSVEESVSHFNISVADGVIDYDGTSEKMQYSEIVDYQCIECNSSFGEDTVKGMAVKQ